MAKGISGGGLDNGVSIAGAPRSMEFLPSGAKVLAWAH